MTSRCVFVMRRRPGMSAQLFVEAWRRGHAQLVVRHAATLGLVGYTQLSRTPRSLTTSVLRAWRGLLRPYDGVDVWWLDRAAFGAALETPVGRSALDAIIESEKTFVDHGASAAWLANAHLFRNERLPTASPQRKLVWVGRGLAPQTNREFQAHYLTFNGPLVSHNAATMAIHRYLQVHATDDPLTDTLRSLRGTGEPFPVHAELTWNVADVFRGGRDAQSASAAINADEMAHIDFARSAIWEADEHVILTPPELALSEAASYAKPDSRVRPRPACLAHKVAVVTGAATGIGRAVALELARRGCDVALVTRHNRAGLEEAAGEIRALGRRASVHLADTADRGRMAELPAEVVGELGAVHVLVNNAGVTLFGDFEQQSLENLDWIVGTNLWGVLHGCKFFLPYLRREGWGHICNVSSLQGLLALTRQSTYAATKFAVRGFSDSLRGELAPLGIGVSCVFPGMIKTGIVATGRADGAEGSNLRSSVASYVDRFAMSAEACARQLVDGIEHNQARVLITPESHVADVLKRLSPTSVDRVFASMMRMGLPNA